MKISVIGCGYLGAVHAASMAYLGHQVVGIDIDKSKIEALSNGMVPFHEPGLTELLRDGLNSGRLAFSTSFDSAADCDTHFIAVGTPQLEESAGADLTYLYDAIESLLPFLGVSDVVIGKSTVPVGTAALVEARLLDSGASLVWNPEFLREGLAVKDTLEPDRIVVGLGSSPEIALRRIEMMYAPLLKQGAPFVVTNFATAELVKGAANSFLATKISFINAMAEIAEAAGADVMELSRALGLDARIGSRFLGPGLGFGGGCLPKDIRAFVARAEEIDRSASVRFLREVDAINLRRRERAAQVLQLLLENGVFGKNIAVLGASFKPESDDIRDSPAIDVADRLTELGAHVILTDPVAVANARVRRPDLSFSNSLRETVQDADAILLATEWSAYSSELSPRELGEMTTCRIIVDGRNCLDRGLWRSSGWNIVGLGESVVAHSQVTENKRHVAPDDSGESADPELLSPQAGV